MNPGFNSINTFYSNFNFKNTMSTIITISTMSTQPPKSLHVHKDENLCIVGKSETKSHNPPTYKGNCKCI